MVINGIRYPPRLTTLEGIRMRHHKTEPTFLGVPCTGPNPEKAKDLHSQAQAYEVLSKFYTLTKEQQLVIAAASEQMVINNMKKAKCKTQ